MHQGLFRSAVIAIAGSLLLPACGDDDVKFDPDNPEGGGGGVGPDPTFVPGPAGMRRILGHQYVRSVNYLLGPQAAGAADPIVDYPIEGFKSIGAAQVAIGLNDPEEYETSATRIADAAVANPATLGAFAPCVLSGPHDASCYDQIARQWGRVAWRRSLDEDEIAKMVGIGQQGQAWASGDFMAGVKYQLMAFLQSPYFIYFTEVGEPDAEDPSRNVLKGTEFASRMSFFLTGRTPDVELLDAAETGQLEDPDLVMAQAERLVSTPEAVENVFYFFNELLFLEDLAGLGKTQELFPQWNDTARASAAEEVNRLIFDVIFTRDADFRELYSADYTFVNDTLAGIYGLPAPGPGIWAQVQHPEAQGRAGWLGTAAFLARFAHPEETSPTRRGQAFVTRLLCEPIDPPPPGVTTELPDVDPNNPLSKKELLLTVHQSDPSCAGCHAILDNPGLVMENFDTIGRARTNDDYGLPVNTTNEVVGLGEVSTQREMVEILMAEEVDRLSLCMVRNVFRNGVGHTELDGEVVELQRLAEGLQEDGHSFLSLMVDFTLSPAFRIVGAAK